MTPDPLTSQLTATAWKDIESAVQSGLAWPVQYGPPHPALADVLVVSREPTTAVEDWASDSSEKIGNGECRVRECNQVSDFMYRYPVSYDELSSPAAEKIKDWATSVREQELVYALTRFAAVATMVTLAKPEHLFAIDPAGWGQRRCIAFTSAASPPKTVPDRWPMAQLDRTVKLDQETPRKGIEAIVFRVAGGPYVRRPADLSLSWMPTADYGIELILTERLEFVGTDTPNSIIGVRMA